VSFTEPTGGKQDLRDELLQLRRALTPAQIEAARAAVCSAVVRRCVDADWSTVAAYLPLRTEQTFGILALASGDARRFHADIGTVYLLRLAELASVAIARFFR